VWKAQAAAYEGERAMFEAYGRRRYTATGVIHWMLNNAWPSLIWNLYDYYLRPSAGYFATKKACEPLHLQYSYDDGSVVAVNGTTEDAKSLRVTAEVFNLDLSSKFRKEVVLDVPADGVVSALVLPKFEGLTSTYFLRLRLEESWGRLLSRNFYWLSTKPDQLDWPAASGSRTPLASAADFTALASLPPADVSATADFQGGEKEGVTHVRVTNRGTTLAFLVRLKLNRETSGEEILPVLWEDNYFELFPGESRDIRATYPFKKAGAASPAIEVSGWNVNRGR
jgi:exo-1,4-beta-D-glucosaminidase